jgi:hypothetical protein
VRTLVRSWAEGMRPISMVDPDLAALRHETYELLRQLFRTMMLRLVRAGLAPTGAGRLYEAESCTPPWTGSSSTASSARPGHTQELMAVVRRYVKSLRGRAA